MIKIEKPQQSTVALSRKTKLYSNYFKIQADPNGLVTSFQIVISPELPPGDSLAPKILKLATPSLLRDMKHPLVFDTFIYLPGNQH